MLDLLIPFILRYKAVFLFYLAIIIFLVIKRKQLDVQAKFIVLYRMKWGLQWMEKVSQKYREWIILLGYIGVGAGYVGLIFISYILIKNLYDLIATPTATSGVSLVLPGINVPGLGILPFWYWLLSLFLIAVVHEFSHGIVARAHKIPVKNTGIVFFGPIIGAFVEPDEQKLTKEKDITQYSVLAAGSFSNIILGILAILLLSLAASPLQQTMVNLEGGVTFNSYYGSGYPFEQNRVPLGTAIISINEQKISSSKQFSEVLSTFKPGDEIIVGTTDRPYTITLAKSPDHEQKAFMGITEIHNKILVKESYTSGIGKVVYTILEWFTGLESGRPGFLGWLFLLSIGIGLFNLLPLPLVDGGRMAQTFLHKLKGPEAGERRYRLIGFFFLLVLILNLIYPWIGKLF